MAKAIEISGPIIGLTTTTKATPEGGIPLYWLLVQDEASGKKYPVYLKLFGFARIPHEGDGVWLKGKLKTVLSDHGNVKSLIKAGDLEWTDAKLAVKASALVARHMKLLERGEDQVARHKRQKQEKTEGQALQDNGFPSQVK